MIRKLEVKGLNNRLDGAWEFNKDLNIITGRNGSGKTTLLKLIWYSISGNLGQIILDIPFRSVLIETDSFSLSIIHLDSGVGKLKYEFVNEGNLDVDFKVPLRDADRKRIDEINEQIVHGRHSLFFPSFRRIEGGFARTPRYISSDEFSLGYIRAEAFSRQRQDRFENRLAEVLQNAISQLSTEISVTDHNFVASISTHDIIELLTKKYTEISEKTDKLHAKLSEDITQKIAKTNPLEATAPVLGDIQKRIDKVTRERESLRKPFVVLGERIREIFHYEGISVTTGITFGETKETIESDKFSAGEKQMLSFLCYNTFSENAAIFIDEPELSLHVDWQRVLLPTLLEQETGNQFFVATHSPFIYTKYPEREILLDEDRGGD